MFFWSLKLLTNWRNSITEYFNIEVKKLKLLTRGTNIEQFALMLREQAQSLILFLCLLFLARCLLGSISVLSTSCLALSSLRQLLMWPPNWNTQREMSKRQGRIIHTASKYSIYEKILPSTNNIIYSLQSRISLEENIVFFVAFLLSRQAASIFAPFFFFFILSQTLVTYTIGKLHLNFYLNFFFRSNVVFQDNI